MNQHVLHMWQKIMLSSSEWVNKWCQYILCDLEQLRLCVAGQPAPAPDFSWLLVQTLGGRGDGSRPWVSAIYLRHIDGVPHKPTLASAGSWVSKFYICSYILI